VKRLTRLFGDIGHLETIGETMKFQSVLEESCLAFDFICEANCLYKDETRKIASGVVHLMHLKN